MIPRYFMSEEEAANPLNASFYAAVLRTLTDGNVSFLVGGAFALHKYTDVRRNTKDLDIFLKRDDRDQAVRVLSKAGFATDIPFPHWLAKARDGARFVDIIHDSANGVCPVDDEWFVHATPSRLYDVPVLLCPVEEMIWTKAFIMERERFDGADVVHLILSCGEELDWERLLARFGDNYRPLLAHLVMFGFVYPAKLDVVPPWVEAQLIGRMAAERHTGEHLDLDGLCRGTLVSREQYLQAVRDFGLMDARIIPIGNLTPEDLAPWTAAIGK